MNSPHQMTPLLPAGPSGWTPKNPDGDDVQYEHRHGVPVNQPSSRPAYAIFRAEGSQAEAQRKKANPPRPPNPFILFRNDYTRKHARGGPKIRRNAHSGPLEDSHSKRAGQAWRALTAEEKQPWQLLAKKAGEEHAKMYPDYRYRPNKRPPASALRRHHRLPTSFCRTSSNERSHSESTRSVSSHSDYDRSSSPTSPSTSESASPPLLVQSEARVIYRRSTSVPTPHPSVSPAIVEGEGSDLSSKRRSRSLHESDSFYPTFPFAESVSTDFTYYQVSLHHLYF